MQEVIFYKSNGDELCRCELESDRGLVYQRKRDFEEYLDKRETPSGEKKGTYKNQASAFFLNLSSFNFMTPKIYETDDDFLYRITNIKTLQTIRMAMSKKDGDSTYQTLNNDRQKTDGSARACLGIYIEFLEKNTKTSITFTQEEKGLFAKALKELIFEVDECVKRDKRTKQDKISHAGTSSKQIKEYLSFLKQYGIDYQVGIGNSWGFLNQDSWIIFAPQKILGENLVNGKTLAPTRGVYAYFTYYGYLQGEKGFGLYFGFPNGDAKQEHGDPSKSQCLAVEQMQKDNALQTYNFTYESLDFERITQDFESMINYFNQFPSSDFVGKNMEIDTSNQVSEINPKDIDISRIKQPLNQILYGSPATGKTYNTIDRALEILGIDCKDKTREERKKLFEDYRQKGQIEFVTFHQSYGYEEFVEGIKPIEENGNITYKVEGGIFKKIVDKATQYSDFDKFYQYLLDSPRTLQGKEGASLYFETNKQGTLIANFTNGEKQLSISREKFKIIFDYFKNKESDFYSMSNMTNKMKEIVEIGIPATSYWAMMNHYFKEYCKPHILIIDEINRGNISKIFGELITLIEPSKRIGSSEELKVKLPYSQDEFGVPSNLYIIGTMNTADRSITSLDTALRRRFEFVEMMPDSSKLSNIKVFKEGEKTEINLSKMLEKINKRIEFLYDREKTIGHAFFLSECKEGENFITLEQLKGIFQNKIIPLLQEYFYNDYALIQAVLNDNEMIKGEEQKPEGLFDSKALVDELELETKKMYSITSDKDIWNDKNTYIKIYQKL